ncbi:MAG: hypothetical protein K2Z80_04870 [Xanthobacteraceae bacterium]|nr:hypothetical protein [Xanthobacteraceae bacterium]
MTPQEPATHALTFEHGAVQIDAAIVADGFGIALPLLLERMRAGEITSRFEQGVDADNGRYRLTFFSKHRRFRIVVDQRGSIIQRTTLDYGDRLLPRSAHRPGA